MKSICYGHMAILACLALSACEWIEGEQELPLSQVPAAALAAANNAVAGIEILEAEVEVENGERVYELEGVADGREHEIEVTADGRVLEIESD